MDIHRQKYFGLFRRRCLSFRLGCYGEKSQVCRSESWNRTRILKDAPFEVGRLTSSLTGKERVNG